MNRPAIVLVVTVFLANKVLSTSLGVGARKLLADLFQYVIMIAKIVKRLLHEEGERTGPRKECCRGSCAIPVL